MSNAKNFVTVACKMPNGLFLELGEFGQDDYQKHFVWGANANLMSPEDMSRTSERLKVAKPLLVNGFALTPGIPREFWDAWMRKHSRATFVRNGFIYADVDGTNSQAHAHANPQPTGFEQRSQANPGTPGITAEPSHQNTTDPKAKEAGVQAEARSRAA